MATRVDLIFEQYSDDNIEFVLSKAYCLRGDWSTPESQKLGVVFVSGGPRTPKKAIVF